MGMDLVTKSLSGETSRILSAFDGPRKDAELTTERARAMTRALTQAVRVAGAAGLRTFQESHRDSSGTMDKDDKRHRHKLPFTEATH